MGDSFEPAELRSFHLYDGELRSADDPSFLWSRISGLAKRTPITSRAASSASLSSLVRHLPPPFPPQARYRP